jgi:hypothetical protein
MFPIIEIAEKELTLAVNIKETTFMDVPLWKPPIK